MLEQGLEKGIRFKHLRVQIRVTSCRAQIMYLHTSRVSLEQTIPRLEHTRLSHAYYFRTPTKRRNNECKKLTDVCSNVSLSVPRSTYLQILITTNRAHKILSKRPINNVIMIICMQRGYTSDIVIKSPPWPADPAGPLDLLRRLLAGPPAPSDLLPVQPASKISLHHLGIPKLAPPTSSAPL